MRRLCFPLLALPLLLWASLAPAQEGKDDWDGGFGGPPAERRSDVTLGGSGSVWLGAASGYPNEADKIDVPAHEASTGFGVGRVFAGWLGGALSDWLTVAVGGFGATLEGDIKTSGAGAFLRVESYPLYSLGGVYRDLSVFGNFGIGQLTMSSQGEQQADGGSMSVVGLGSFWEAWRPGSFAFGPSLEWFHMSSQTLASNGALLGVRIAFYGGPGAAPTTTARR